MTSPGDGLGANAGTAHVLITPELRGFAKALGNQLKAAVKPFASDFEKELSKIGAKPIRLPVTPQFPDQIPPSSLPRKAPKVPVELDPLAKQFQADLKKELAGLTRQVSAEIPVNPATDNLRSELARELQRLQKQLTIEIPTEPADVRQYERDLRAQIDAAKAGITAEIRTTLDSGGVTAEARAVKEQIQRAASPVKIAVELDRGRLREGIAQIGSTLAKGIGGLAVAGAATVSVVGLTGAVTALAGAVAVSSGALVGLPALLLGAGSAALVARVGLLGVNEAFSALAEGDTDKLDEALKKLAPNARSFVREVAKVAPALKSAQQSIQGNLFEGLSRFVRPLVDTYLPKLRQFGFRIAADFNAAAQRAAQFGLAAATTRDVVTVLGNIRTASSTLAPALVPLLQAFRDIAAVGSEGLPRLAAGITGAARSFAAFIASARQSGSLAAFFRSGVDTLAQLGRITGNVALGIVGIFRAGSTEGGNFLDALERMTARFREFVASVGGQAALKQFFADSAVVVGALASAVAFVAEKIGQLTAAFSRLPESVKPIVAQLLLVGGGVALVAGKLAALAPVVSGLAGVIGAIGAGPFLAITAAVVGVGAAFVYAHQQSAEFRTLLSEAFSTIGGIARSAVATVRPALQQFAAIFRDELKPAIDDAISTVSTNLRPAFVKLGEVWRSDIQPALAGIVQKLQEAEPELRAFASAAGAVVRFLAGLTSSGPAVALFSAIGVAARIAGAGLSLAIGNFRAAVQFIQAVPGFFAGVGAAISSFFSGVGATVSTAGSAIGGFFAALPGRIMAALGALASTVTAPLQAMFAGARARCQRRDPEHRVVLRGAARSAARGHAAGPRHEHPDVGPGRGDVAAAGRDGFNAIVSFVAGLPGRISAALSSLVSIVGAIVTNTWNRARALFTSGVAAAVSLATTLPGRVGSAISSLVSRLGSIASSAWSTLRSAFSSGVSQAVSIAASLPGRIAGALGGMAGRFRSIGSDIISGLVSGIRSGVGAVASAARDVAASAVSAAKSALGIGSPSKVMAREVGKWIPAGLAVGIHSNAGVVEEEMLRITQSVVPALPSVSALAAGAVPVPFAAGSQSRPEYHLHEGSASLITQIEAYEARRDALARAGRPS